jgi:hypothetical protein
MQLKRKTMINNYYKWKRNSALHRDRGVLLVVERKKEGRGYVGRLQVFIAALRKVEPFWGMMPC